MASIFLQPAKESETDKWRQHYNNQQEELLREVRALRNEVRELKNK